MDLFKELEGILPSDAEIRKETATVKVIQAREANAWHEAMKKVAQDPEWLKNTTEANKRRAQDPEWREKNAEAGKLRSQDPEWQKNVAQANKLKAQDPEWQAAQKAGIRLHQGKAIVTPEGKFDSVAEAVDYYWDNKILPTRKTKPSVRKFLDTQTKKEGSGFEYV